MWVGKLGRVSQRSLRPSLPFPLQSELFLCFLSITRGEIEKGRRKEEGAQLASFLPRPRGQAGHDLLNLGWTLLGFFAPSDYYPSPENLRTADIGFKEHDASATGPTTL